MEIERPLKSEIVNLLREYNCNDSPNHQSLTNNNKIEFLERPSNISYCNLSEQKAEKFRSNERSQLMQMELDNDLTYNNNRTSGRIRQLKEYYRADFQTKGIAICNSIIDIQVAQPVTIIVTLFKDRESISDQSTKMKQFSEFLIYIEDETGRMVGDFSSATLNSSIYSSNNPVNRSNLTSGMLVGLHGVQRVQDVNVFEVLEVLYCDLPYQQRILDLPALNEKTVSVNQNQQTFESYIKNPSESTFILLTSGFNIGIHVDRSPLRSLIFHLFGLSNLKKLMSRVSRVVLAGNLMDKCRELQAHLIGSYRVVDEFAALYSQVQQRIREGDEITFEISKNVCFDVMPGSHDSNEMQGEVNEQIRPPTQFLQKPLSRCYFQNTLKQSQSTHLNLVPNPYEFELNQIQLLAISGQSVEETRRQDDCSEMSDADILEQHLLQRHIAPCGPKSCSKGTEQEDPFVIHELPHVFFSGNAESFSTKLVHEPSTNKRCRIIGVPALSKSNSFVLLNIDNLDVFEVKL